VPLPGTKPAAQPPVPPAAALPEEALEVAEQTPLLATVPEPQVVTGAAVEVVGFEVEPQQPPLDPED
jgi:hypothetical protein